MVPAMRSSLGKHALAAAAVCVLAASPAHAEKNKKVASALAGTGTGIASALILSSFLIHPQDEQVYLPTFYSGIGLSIFAPSLGHFYAGRYFTVGMAIRGTAAAVAAIGIAQKQDQKCVGNDSIPNCPTVTANGLVLVSLAAIAYIGGVAYDVRDAPNAVEHYNKMHVSVIPKLMPHGGGLALTGSF
jgi:hypothetical protein